MSAKHLFKNIIGQPVVKSPSLFFLVCGKTQREWQDSDAGGGFPSGGLNLRVQTSTRRKQHVNTLRSGWVAGCVIFLDNPYERSVFAPKIAFHFLISKAIGVGNKWMRKEYIEI